MISIVPFSETHYIINNLPPNHLGANLLIIWKDDIDEMVKSIINKATFPEGASLQGKPLPLNNNFEEKT